MKNLLRLLQNRSAEHRLGTNRLIHTTSRAGARRSVCQSNELGRGFLSFWKIGAVFLSVMLLPALVSAQEGKATLAVSSIKAIPALTASLKPGRQLELNRIIESLNSQLIDRINATRKFTIVGRSDLNDIIKEQDLGASGNVDAKTAAKAGKLTGAKYLLVASVDDFQDYVETAKFAGTGRSATKRVFRFSIVAKIYDSSTGKLLESANLQTGNDAFKDIHENRSYSVKNGELSDEMMVAVSRTMAGKIADHVANVIFPIRVLVKRDQEVMINRGQGGGVAVGEIFNVYAQGQELKDPDTGEVLGREEAKVGKVKITEVDPKFSKATVLEDTGIDRGAILRKPQ